MPTDTPTVTPTREILYNQPGFYPVGGCASYDLPDLELSVDFCVLSVEVLRDGKMMFTVSWTTHLPKDHIVTKYDDSSNRKMNVTDDLGNRYDTIGAGDAAKGDVKFVDGKTLTGWFLFGKPYSEARIFTFHDDNQGISIGGLKLIAPIILKAVVELNFYPLALEYILEYWEIAEGDEGGIQFNHKKYPFCSVTEIPGNEPEGPLKNTLELGQVTYQMYRWFEDDWSVRQYMAVQGLPGLGDEMQPIFQTIIPYADELDCAYAVTTLLGSLGPLEEQ